MNCPNCQAPIPEGTKFCTSCGAPIAVEEPKLSAKQRGVKKAQFLKTEAAPAVKKMAKASLIVFAVIVALILIATVNTNSMSMLDLPVVILTADEDEREELQDQLENAGDELNDLDDVLEQIEDEYDSKTVKSTEKFIEKIQDAARKTSLNSIITMVNACEDFVDEVDEEIVEKMDIEDALEDIREVASILEVIRAVIYIFGIIVILLALWAALSKITWLSIFCLILYTPVCALLSSILIAVLVFVAFIALAVTTSRVNKAWKRA